MPYSNSQLEDVAAHLIAETLGDGVHRERIPQGAGPDFKLSWGDSAVGLEITLLLRSRDHDEQPRRAVEGLREQLLEGARREWHSQNGPPVEVHVSFAWNSAPTKEALRADAARLCSFVSARLRLMSNHATYTSDWKDERALPPSVTGVSIARFQTLTEAFWLGTDASMVPDLSPSQVQLRIDSKEPKIDRYRSVVPEVWLGIVLDGYRPSGHFTITDEVRAATYISGFARVFLVDAFRGLVHQLQRRSRNEAA